MRIDDFLDLDALFRPFGAASSETDAAEHAHARAHDDACRSPDADASAGRSRHFRRKAGPRRRRWFERGDLKFAVLALVKEKPMHGYEVMQALERESRGCYKASAGSVYPTLQLLEDQGHVTVQEWDGKKVYSITDQGRSYLNEHRDHVDQVFERLSRLGDRIGRDAADLSRDLSELARRAFRGTARWIDDDKFLGEVKEIVNRAAKEIDAAWEDARRRCPER